jgi:Holliday junction resolvasome RuvABC endonuclease subunit
MVIMAIDPGFATTGAALMELSNGQWRCAASELIKTEPPKNKGKLLKGDADFARCMELARGLRRLAAAHKVFGVVMELPPGGAKSASAVRAMALVTGICAGVLDGLDLAYEVYQPGDVKKAAIGGRTGSKEEMMAWAVDAHPETAAEYCRKAGKLLNAFEHVADALAVFAAAKGGNLVRTAEKVAAAGRA